MNQFNLISTSEPVIRYHFITLMLFFCISACAQQQDYRYFYAEADKAYREKNYKHFYELIHKANDLHPYHQVILYKTGIAAALNNFPGEAVLYLKRALLVDAGFDLLHPDLAALTGRKDFAGLITLQQELNRPIVQSDTAFIIRDRQLHAEGIAFDSQTGSFYIGSIHKRKIVRVDASGLEHDFTNSGAAGMTSVFGLKADVKHHLLWACSSPMEEMENYDAELPSFVFRFNLSNGKLEQTFAAPAEVKGSIFGDLQLGPKGGIYISDSRNNIVFIVNEQKNSLDKYFDWPEFRNIQGITFSDNGQYLFIADYITGLYRLDVKTKTLTRVTCDAEVSLKGIDGLTYYKGSLVAVQNGVNPLRVTRYYLNPEKNEIDRYEILDRAHPSFGEPTLGTLAGDTFYYIANSQWAGYDDDHTIKPSEQLHDIVILKSDLSKSK